MLHAGGQEAPAAAHAIDEAMVERPVSEEPATGISAPEAAYAAEPIATGVFAGEEWRTDDAFLEELKRLLDDHVCPELQGLGFLTDWEAHGTSCVIAYAGSCLAACRTSEAHAGRFTMP